MDVAGPRLIATPTGDHAAHHPAILAAIRNAVLPVAAVSPSEHIPGQLLAVGLRHGHQYQPGGGEHFRSREPVVTAFGSALSQVFRRSYFDLKN